MSKYKICYLISIMFLEIWCVASMHFGSYVITNPYYWYCDYKMCLYFSIQELGLEMCFRINLPFSDLTWWHYNYLPAYMLNVSILWWRAFDCYVEATRSCVIYVFELFPFWKVYHYLYCARFQYRNRNAAISFMTTSPSWKWMLLSIYFEYWKILRMERKSTEWTILSLYSEYYQDFLDLIV